MILATYVLAEKSGLDSQMVVTVAAGVFILPFFLFSATAGQLADSVEKSGLIRVIKLFEIILMAMAAFGFVIGNIYFLIFVLFLMGTQSTFFGPVKYSILPDHLSDDELISGNAYIEMGTFISILLGTIVGGVLILLDGGIYFVSGLLLLLSVTGFASSRFIPKAKIDSKNVKLNPNFIGETYSIVKTSSQNKDVFVSIVAISWFWFVGATFLAQFPNYVKNILHGTEGIVTLLLSTFSIGIAIGSMLCNTLVKGKITAKLSPFALLFMSLFCIDFYWVSQSIPMQISGEFLNLNAFLSNISGFRIVADLVFISIGGGVFIVPLYAILQHKSEESLRARMMASNNIINALFMVISAGGAAVLLANGFSVPDMFLGIGIMNVFVAFYIYKAKLI